MAEAGGSRLNYGVPGFYCATSPPDLASKVIEEKPPQGEDRNSSAIKLDGNKSPVWEGCFQYFPKALKAVAEVSQFGAKKYNQSLFPTKWRDVSNALARYTNALSRHLLDEANGERYALDSKLLHASHLAWNALARLEKIIEEEEANNFLDKLQNV